MRGSDANCRLCVGWSGFDLMSTLGAVLTQFSQVIAPAIELFSLS